MEHLKTINLNQKQSGHYYSDIPQEYSVSYHPNKGGTYVIEIDDEISHVSQFKTAVQVLNIAKEEDEVEILLSCCPGGSVDAGDTLLHAMRKCQAHIRIIASGGVHSMGTHILLEADEFELSGGFNALIHCGSNGAYGAVNEYVAKSKFDLEFRTRQFREAYEGFLSDKEIEEVLEGKDIWLDGEGWCSRALARMQYFQSKIDNFKKEAQKASRKPRIKKTPKPVVDTSEKPVVE